jgi:hypothetical protein
MAEQLLGPDGQPVDLAAAEDTFNAAMAAPADGEKPDYPAPPRRDEEAPFGRKADGTPRARRAGPGRPRDDKARTGSVPKAPPKGKPGAPAGPPGDYTEVLSGFGQAVWMALAAVPVPHTQAFAAVWQVQLDAEVAAWNTAAQQDANVRRAVERLAGGPTWIVGVAVATAPLVGGAIALARDEKIRGELAEQTQAEFGKLIGKMAAEQDQAQAAA